MHVKYNTYYHKTLKESGGQFVTMFICMLTWAQFIHAVRTRSFSLAFTHTPKFPKFEQQRNFAIFGISIAHAIGRITHAMQHGKTRRSRDRDFQIGRVIKIAIFSGRTFIHTQTRDRDRSVRGMYILQIGNASVTRRRVYKNQYAIVNVLLRSQKSDSASSGIISYAVPDKIRWNSFRKKYS